MCDRNIRVARSGRICAVVLAAATTLLMVASASGQTRIQASVNTTTVGVDEVVSYSIEISGANLSDVRVPDPPETENLRLAQPTPSTSRNVSIVNGSISQSVTYRWSYLPLAEGPASIASTTVQVGASRFDTEPIRVTVVPQSQRPAPQAQQPGAWPFSTRPRARDDAPTALSDSDLFIRAVPTRREAYPNEQIVIEYHLFFREHVQVRQSRLADSWDAKGFWREELDVDARPVARTVVENGLRYRTIVLKRVAVFPTRAGILTVDPLRIDTEIYASGRSNDPFSSFFPTTNVHTAQVSSPAVEIRVHPLPDGAPSNFSGAVGQFQMEASLDRRSVDVGETVQVLVRLSGTGNLSTLSPPELDIPGVFERYDPSVETQINRSGRMVTGRKTITYVLVPRSNGVFELPEASFAYFDPVRREYAHVRAPLGRLEITGNAGPLVAQATRGGLPVDDIAGLKIGDSGWTRLDRTPLHASPLPYVVLGLPLFLLAGAFAYRRRTDRLSADLQFARGRRAHPLARKHLRQADLLLKANRPKEFYAEVERALLSFIGNRLNVAEVGLTRQQLNAHLHAHGISVETRGDANELLDECERAQFAPLPPERSIMETAIERAGKVIVRVNAEATVRGVTSSL